MELTTKNEMEFFLALKVLLQFSLGWLGLMTLFQQLNEDMFKELTENLPSRVIMIFGFFYLIFSVIKKGHDTYTSIQINRLKIKEEKERHEQSKIYTAIKNKELDDEK